MLEPMKGGGLTGELLFFGDRQTRTCLEEEHDARAGPGWLRNWILNRSDKGGGSVAASPGQGRVC
jgi:hypothetical protein